MEKALLMSWPRTDIEAIVERQPRLGLGLMQIFAERCVQCEERLESLAVDKTSKRVALSLLHLARLGIRESDGAVRIPPLTHQLLSGFVGTSREIVTTELKTIAPSGIVAVFTQSHAHLPGSPARLSAHNIVRLAIS